VIDDINDNAPEFDTSTVRISVPENVELGSPLYEAHAKDRDSGENSIIRYRLVGSSSAGVFAMDARLGHLTLLKHLDYETAQRHSLVIQASDTGTPSLSSNLTVLVEVQDVNDNTPVFEKEEYAVKIVESLAVNSQVSGFDIFQRNDLFQRKNCPGAVLGGVCLLSVLTQLSKSTEKEKLRRPLVDMSILNYVDDRHQPSETAPSPFVV